MTKMMIFSLLLGLLITTSCDIATSPVQSQPSNEASPVLPAGGLLVGSFNAQVFGKTKASKPEVLSRITAIIQEYDIIAFQEIRDSSLESVSTLMSKLPEYKIAIGPALGRTTSKENYAYIYDPTRVQILETYTYNDAEDRFEREPFVAHVVTPEYEFTIIQVHTKPDDAVHEIQALYAVAQDAIVRYNDTEVLITGDLNADCDYYDVMLKDISLPGYIWITPDDFDTTTKYTDCTYDRFIGTEQFNQLVAGTIVNRFDLNYGLGYDETIAVSDHYPITLRLKVKT